MIDSTAVAAHAVISPNAFLGAVFVVFLTSALFAYRAVVALAARGPDDRGTLTSWALLKSIPSTNARIVVELALACLFVVGCMVADMIGRPISQATQSTLGLFIAAMLGIGAGQFVGKRATDSDYVKAKKGPGTTVNAEEAKITGSPVNVETPPTEDRK